MKERLTKRERQMILAREQEIKRIVTVVNSEDSRVRRKEGAERMAGKKNVIHNRGKEERNEEREIKEDSAGSCDSEGS